MTVRHLLRTVAWIALSIVVSAITATAVTDEPTPIADAAAAPAAAEGIERVEPEQRATVELKTHRVEPVLSLQGSLRTASDGGLEIQSLVTPADLAYRLIDEPVAIRAQIHGGPAGFDCLYRGLFESSDGAGTALICAVPSSVRAVAGLEASVVVVLERAAEVAVLPRSAVVGDVQRGRVVVVTSAGWRTREVNLGRSDSQWIEITAGLQPGDRVLERPTQLDFDSVP